MPWMFGPRGGVEGKGKRLPLGLGESGAGAGGMGELRGAARSQGGRRGPSPKQQGVRG